MKVLFQLLTLIMFTISCGKIPEESLETNSIDSEYSSSNSSCRSVSECREICDSYNYTYNSHSDCISNFSSSGVDISSGSAISACPS